MDREKLIDRIRKLLALAKDAGATVEEASAAAVKARELMHQYGLDQIEIDAAEMESEEVGLGRSRRDRVDAMIAAIAYATGTVPTLIRG